MRMFNVWVVVVGVLAGVGAAMVVVFTHEVRISPAMAADLVSTPPGIEYSTPRRPSELAPMEAVLAGEQATHVIWWTYLGEMRFAGGDRPGVMNDLAVPAQQDRRNRIGLEELVRPSEFGSPGDDVHGHLRQIAFQIGQQLQPLLDSSPAEAGEPFQGAAIPGGGADLHFMGRLFVLVLLGQRQPGVAQRGFFRRQRRPGVFALGDLSQSPIVAAGEHG